MFSWKRTRNRGALFLSIVRPGRTALDPPHRRTDGQRAGSDHVGRQRLPRGVRPYVQHAVTGRQGAGRGYVGQPLRAVDNANETHSCWLIDDPPKGGHRARPPWQNRTWSGFSARVLRYAFVTFARPVQPRIALTPPPRRR
ncbi:hypothetical protein PLANTIT3_60748 [Plantibacter sp. T3]|nr:hypothetical protein PLANTIT3_60748 [Plantibacter sp. T3]